MEAKATFTCLSRRLAWPSGHIAVPRALFVLPSWAEEKVCFGGSVEGMLSASCGSFSHSVA